MILVYGECRQNSEEARRMYTEKFPNRRVPATTYFRKVEIKETQHNQKFIISEEAEMSVLGYVEYKPCRFANSKIIATEREKSLEK